MIYRNLVKKYVAPIASLFFSMITLSYMPEALAGEALYYNQVVQIKGNREGAWGFLWNHSRSPFNADAQTDKGNYTEIMIGGPNNDARVNSSASFFAFRNALNQNDTGTLKVGDTVEILVLGCNTDLLAAPSKLWSSKKTSYWFYNYGCTVVGTHDENGKSFFTNSANGQFIIEGGNNQPIGTPLTSTDTIKLKVLNPEMPQKYLWTIKSHKIWTDFGTILIGGENGGADTWGIQYVGGDRSLSPANQFNVTPVPTTNPQQAAAKKLLTITSPVPQNQGPTLPLNYNQAVQIKGNLDGAWDFLWNHSRSPFNADAQTDKGNYTELLVGGPNNDARVNSGASFFAFRNALNQNDTGTLKVGDTVEILVLGCNTNLLAAPSKVWSSKKTSDWFYNYGCTVVGTHDENGKSFFTNSANGQFIIEGGNNQPTGTPLTSIDTIKLKVLNPEMPQKYLWTIKAHKMWAGYGTILIGGENGGTDTWGIQYAGGDRSLSALNRFSVIPVLTTNPQQAAAQKLLTLQSQVQPQAQPQAQASLTVPDKLNDGTNDFPLISTMLPSGLQIRLRTYTKDAYGYYLARPNGAVATTLQDLFLLGGTASNSIMAEFVVQNNNDGTISLKEKTLGGNLLQAPSMLMGTRVGWYDAIFDEESRWSIYGTPDQCILYNVYTKKALVITPTQSPVANALGDIKNANADAKRNLLLKMEFVGFPQQMTPEQQKFLYDIVLSRQQSSITTPDVKSTATTLVSSPSKLPATATGSQQIITPTSQLTTTTSPYQPSSYRQSQANTGIYVPRTLSSRMTGGRPGVPGRVARPVLRRFSQ